MEVVILWQTTWPDIPNCFRNSAEALAAPCIALIFVALLLL